MFVLLQPHIAIDMRNSLEETALHLAARKGSLNSLNALLKETEQSLLEIKDYDGWTVLFSAIFSGIP